MKKVLAIFGGDSTEHDISILTAVEALHACPYVGYKIYPAYILNGHWYTGEKLLELTSFKPFIPSEHCEITLQNRDIMVKKWGKFKKLDTVDCALILTHGGGVEGGELQGYLETLGIPYTSPDTFSSAVCMDKYTLKRLLYGEVNLVDGVVVRDCKDESLEMVERALAYPLFVKPNSQGSSIGVGVAVNKEELKERVKLSLLYDEKVLVESKIEDFKEYNVASFKVGETVKVSSVEMPLNATDFLSFEDKYLENVKTACLCKREFPAKISVELEEEIRETTSKIYTLLGLKGVVRFDYIYKDKLYLNEVNTVPGSLAHYLFEELTYTELLTLLIDEAIEHGSKVRASFESQVLNFGRPK